MKLMVLLLTSPLFKRVKGGSLEEIIIELLRVRVKELSKNINLLLKKVIKLILQITARSVEDKAIREMLCINNHLSHQYKI